MSGHIPDFEEIRDSNRPDSDPEFDREDTLTGLGERGRAPHAEIPPPSADAKSTDKRLEQLLSAAIVLLDQRTRSLEQQETARQFRELRADIARSENEKELRRKQEHEEMLGRVSALSVEMRHRTPGPVWKSIVIGMIALGLLGLGGLGVFVFRGAVALERIQQQQEQDR